MFANWWDCPSWDENASGDDWKKGISRRELLSDNFQSLSTILNDFKAIDFSGSGSLLSEEQKSFSWNSSSLGILILSGTVPAIGLHLWLVEIGFKVKSWWEVWCFKLHKFVIFRVFSTEQTWLKPEFWILTTTFSETFAFKVAKIKINTKLILINTTSVLLQR